MRPKPLSNATAVAALLLAIGCTETRADIYKWVDDQGTLNFTDDPSSIPASKRNQSTAPFIKEPKGSAETGADSAPPVPSTEGSTPAPETVSRESGENGAEALRREIEQLKAKISAKEAHIQAVDAKRSLATNPLRNRIVSPADLDLYQKYKTELPQDHERLRQIEARQ